MAVALTAVSAVRDLRAAREDLARLRPALDVDALLEGSQDAALERAASQLDRGAGRLGGALLAPARILPFAGRQLRAARDLGHAAATSVRVSMDAIRDARAILDDGVEGGRERAAALARLADVADSARATIAALDHGPAAETLVGALRTARRDFEAETGEVVAVLDDIRVGARGFAQFVNGPSRYLVFAANNSQMQNGSGMFLSWGILEANGGSLSLSPITTINQLALPSPPVPLDEEFRAVFGFLDPNRDWRHLGASPRFPATARQAVEMWTAAGGGAVDGVLVIDPFVLEALLEADWSFDVEGGTITRDGVVRHLLHDQYQGLPFDGAGEENSERRADLSDIAADVMESLDGHREIDAALLNRLATAVRSRHLLMWSRDEDVQRAFAAAGATGDVEPESLTVGVLNRSGVKLDWFVDVSATMSARPAGHQRLTVTVTNDADIDEPRYVVGPFPGSGLERGEYLGLAVVTLPEGSAVAAVEPAGALVTAGTDGGRPTVTARVQARAGESATVAVDFAPPLEAVVIEPSARARPVAWTVGTARWTDGAPRRVTLRTLP